MLGAEEAKLRDYFSQKGGKIEKMLSHFAPDSVILQVKGEKFIKHSAFEVELVLQIPMQVISSKEASHMITKAVDLAVDRLIMQLKKSVGIARRGHRSIKARSKVKMRAPLPAL